MFDGDDPLGWFSRVEQYFSLNAVNESEMLNAAVVCLEGRTLNWYHWVENHALMPSWEEFKQELLHRLHSYQLGDEYEMLLALRQERKESGT